MNDHELYDFYEPSKEDRTRFNLTWGVIAAALAVIVFHFFILPTVNLGV